MDTKQTDNYEKCAGLIYEAYVLASGGHGEPKSDRDHRLSAGLRSFFQVHPGMERVGSSYQPPQKPDPGRRLAEITAQHVEHLVEYGAACAEVGIDMMEERLTAVHDSTVAALEARVRDLEAQLG